MKLELIVCRIAERVVLLSNSRLSFQGIAENPHFRFSCEFLFSSTFEHHGCFQENLLLRAKIPGLHPQYIAYLQHNAWFERNNRFSFLCQALIFRSMSHPMRKKIAIYIFKVLDGFPDIPIFQLMRRTIHGLSF